MKNSSAASPPRIKRGFTYALIACVVSVSMSVPASPVAASPQEGPRARSSFTVPTETKAQFQERQRAGRVRGRASVDRGAVWCYVYSTALGFYWPPAGAATGALCLFAKQGPAVARYSCYRTAPVNLGYGLVAAYGAKSAYRMGRCYRGEWGYSHMKLRWSQFKK